MVGIGFAGCRKCQLKPGIPSVQLGLPQLAGPVVLVLLVGIVVVTMKWYTQAKARRLTCALHYSCNHCHNSRHPKKHLHHSHSQVHPLSHSQGTLHHSQYHTAAWFGHRDLMQWSVHVPSSCCDIVIQLQAELACRASHKHAPQSSTGNLMPSAVICPCYGPRWCQSAAAGRILCACCRIRRLSKPHTTEVHECKQIPAGTSLSSPQAAGLRRTRMCTRKGVSLSTAAAGTMRLPWAPCMAASVKTPGRVLCGALLPASAAMLLL